MKTRRRYASIDFLRGISIFMMYVFHILNNLLDFDSYFTTETIGTTPLAIIKFLIELAIFGGLAGLFLMVSSMSHMISMYRHLESGNSVMSLALRQVIRGLILLLFAFVMESTLGTWGLLGQIFQRLDNLSEVPYDIWRYRFVHMETVHTIAWCMILNGMVQALLSIKGHWKKYTQMMLLYVVLAIIVLVFTPLIWQAVDNLLPGYPYSTRVIIRANGENQHMKLMLPYIGYDNFWYVLRSILLAPLAGYVEPIFPYLACSFLGSIIGIYISKPREQVKSRGLKIIMWVGISMFIIGTTGLLVNYYNILDTHGFGAVYQLFRRLYVPRLYSSIGTENAYGGFVAPPFAGWLFQFLGLNGLAMVIITVLLRLVEFRGAGAKLARKTRFIRRFGFIAFTLYTIQWIYFIVFFLVTKYLIPAVSSISIEPYGKLTWGWLLVDLAITLTIYLTLNYLWEKIGYIGSLEWWMSIIGLVLVPGAIRSYREARKLNENTSPWWKPLNVKNSFYNAEWLSFGNIEESDRSKLLESKLSLRLSIAGLLFMPVSIVALAIGVKSKKLEPKNQKNATAILVSCIGIGLSVIIIIVLFMISLESIGLASLLGL